MKKIIICLSWVLCGSVMSQNSVPDDTSSVDKIIQAMYQVISGPAGQRDWNRFNHLFTQESQLGAIFKSKTGELVFRSFSPQDYIKKNDPYFLANAFYEKELHRTTHTFGGLVNVFTTYEFESGEVKQRGINSLQLIYHKNRWWIFSLIWQEETDVYKIPKEFLLD